MKTYRIHFIRHGLTQGAEEGRYIGHTDADLSRDGILQLEDMQRDMVYPQASALFSSPLKRCMHTAQLLYPDRTPIEMEGLIEYNFGEFDGKSADELLSGKKADLFTASVTFPQGRARQRPALWREQCPVSKAGV